MLQQPVPALNAQFPFVSCSCKGALACLEPASEAEML